MSRDTELVEMLLANTDFVSHETIGRPAEQTLPLYDLLIQWFSESLIEEHEGTAGNLPSRPHPARIGAAGLPTHGSIWGTVHRRALWARLDQIRMPRLDRIRVGLEPEPDPIQETGPARKAPVKTARKAEIRKPRAAKPVRVPEPKKTSAVVPKASPTQPESVVKPPTTTVITAPPSPPKPLKVIRRRKEEEPKVFETPPRSFPKAMLEGISSVLEEVGDQKGND